VELKVHVHDKCEMYAALGDHSAHGVIMQHCKTGLIFGRTQERSMLKLFNGPFSTQTDTTAVCKCPFLQHYVNITLPAF